jgi:hypothetical protein
LLIECAPFVDSTGEVSEWSNVPDSKSGVALCVTVGSNPTLSASRKSHPQRPEFAGTVICAVPH